MARIHGVSSSTVQPLAAWSMAVAPQPGLAAADAGALSWIPALVPGTAAHALRAAGRGDELIFSLDEKEVWYRCAFAGDAGPPGTRVLRLGGLATLCDVFVNRHHVLRSENMFLSHAVDVSHVLHGENELLLRFSPLDAELRKKRPRPRWKTPLVARQQLRFVRTSVVGHATTWRVPPPVGPYREVALERRELPASFEVDLRPGLVADEGVISLRVRVVSPSGLRASGGSLAVGGVKTPVQITDDGARATLQLPRARRWWPATHGEPFLYDARLDLSLGDSPLRIDLGKIGFRTVEIDRSDRGFRFVVNGVPVFARGTCWSPPDPLRMWLPREDYERSLRAVRDGGANMVRVSGTFAYPPEFFHDLCDQLGVLLWQDFMFAGMDYPDDPEFCAAVAEEARQICDRVQASPSLAMLCGGSDGALQPALFGLPWQDAQAGVRGILAAECLKQVHSVPFLANSPGGGVAPFHPEEGVTHYYGVGAFLRPVEDVRRSDVRFAAECLGFANVPDQHLVDRWLPAGDAPVASPAWKAGVPRDAHQSYDFDDVRDVYARRMFGVDPLELRAHDPERYVALSRVVTGELMAAVFSEFRRVGSRCGGGLVWTHCDLWQGAGWGLLDVDGHPKPAFWILRRALAPRAVLLTDEGLNGLALHAINDRPEPLEAEIGFAMYRGETAVASGSRAITVPAHGGVRVLSEDLLGRFADTAYAYRFGPPSFDVAVARLCAGGLELSSAIRFPGVPPHRPVHVGLQASAEACGGGFLLRLRARTLAYCVALTLPPGCTPDDNYLHLIPGIEREVFIEAPGVKALRGAATPLNGEVVSFAASREATP
jgi:beta-mannosidase